MPHGQLLASSVQDKSFDVSWNRRANRPLASTFRCADGVTLSGRYDELDEIFAGRTAADWLTGYRDSPSISEKPTRARPGLREDGTAR
ncbi:hypothetical protein FPZ12_016775 [Amycolatopsis acidicola]|uniref:Uncharacterized protein n=1 Tax=Amycolatopsis acidicola TaxID=2596893 RepID=A0A5N0V234_9PSEU|nr:hypothetical protein [Amycolatopsis acidicola]KAA9160489.1 hypothetical protein FPZ12_016775 [Amycolatopsis acidicola]